jgi:hypothetical protein
LPYGVRQTRTGTGSSVAGRHTSADSRTPSRMGTRRLRSSMIFAAGSTSLIATSQAYTATRSRGKIDFRPPLVPGDTNRARCDVALAAALPVPGVPRVRLVSGPD